MLPKLENLISQLKPRPKQVMGQGIRDYELKEIKQFCESKGLKYFPEELVKLPRFAQEVNDFISTRSRMALPVEQFEGKFIRNDFSKLVEIGGVLGYNQELFEISYSYPDPSNVGHIIELPTGVDVSRKIWAELYGGNPSDANIFSSSCSNGKINDEEFKRADQIIDWHTHPLGFGELSVSDAKYIDAFVNKYDEDKQFHFVVFVPSINKSIWYQAKRFSD